MGWAWNVQPLSWSPMDCKYMHIESNQASIDFLGNVFFVKKLKYRHGSGLLVNIIKNSFYVLGVSLSWLRLEILSENFENVH